jgi:two-component system cell cycle sensor histidine kinase/response regulator CckA
MGNVNSGLAVGGDSEVASRLAAIVESSDDAIIGKTLDGIITSWNSGASAMYGYAADEMVGQDISVLIPPDRAGELGPILGRLRRGEHIGHFETTRLRKDGSLIDVSVSVSPIRDATGAVVGASTVARDMTARNHREAGRRAMEARLHQAERMETVGQMAGGIAHDFNNVLGVIVGYAGLVAEETADRPAVLADVEQISAAAKRAARLTRQLLIFSRRDPAQPEAVSLGAIISDLQGLLSVSVGGQVELRFDTAAILPAIQADRGQVEQVLLNLAVNARDAMPLGGILTIGTALAEFDEGHTCLHPAVNPGRYVVLTVGDTGNGMSKEVMARIFDPFFTTKPLGRGTGLGLSTVHGIVTRAGGSVSVDSAEGIGTTFQIYFPAIGAAAAASPAAAAPGAVPGVQGNGETILVVDAEPSVRQVVSRILRGNGYATHEARSSEEALALASSHDVQLLLTDSVMQDMSGPALAERAAELRPGLRVLHMSGYSAGVLGAHAPCNGTAAFVEKPFTAQALLEQVHAVLSVLPAA